jgi:hypothetical protein
MPKEASAIPTIWEPNPGPQLEFLSCPEREALYGGAAGGGKSDGLLVAAASDKDSPWMRSILIRRTFPELKDLIRRSKDIYPAMGGRYRESTKEWFFKEGGIIEFAYLKKESDKYNYQGRQFSFIGWDELTQWKNDLSYLYLLSRLRAPKGANVTLRVRATTNPGGVGHHWVKSRFGIQDDGLASSVYDEDTDTNRVFIPAKIVDNPFLHGTTYEKDLNALPENLRRMLKEGRWDILEGVMFTEWDQRIHVVKPFALPGNARIWRSCDDGHNAPAAVLWFAEIDSRVYVVAELYQNGLVAEDLGAMTLRRDKRLPILDADGVRYHEGTLSGPIDPSAFADTGMKRNRGESRGKTMNEMGCNWRPAHKGANSRRQGCQLIHSMLKGKLTDGLPKIQIFQNCKNLIRTMPALPIDGLDPEDIDTTAEDHAYDALRYGLQSSAAVIRKQRLKGS